MQAIQSTSCLPALEQWKLRQVGRIKRDSVLGVVGVLAVLCVLGVLSGGHRYMLPAALVITLACAFVLLALTYVKAKRLATEYAAYAGRCRTESLTVDEAEARGHAEEGSFTLPLGEITDVTVTARGLLRPRAFVFSNDVLTFRDGGGNSYTFRAFSNCEALADALRGGKPPASTV